MVNFAQTPWNLCTVVLFDFTPGWLHGLIERTWPYPKGLTPGWGALNLKGVILTGGGLGLHPFQSAKILRREETFLVFAGQRSRLLLRTELLD